MGRGQETLSQNYVGATGQYKSYMGPFHNSRKSLAWSCPTFPTDSHTPASVWPPRPCAYRLDARFEIDCPWGPADVLVGPLGPEVPGGDDW